MARSLLSGAFLGNILKLEAMLNVDFTKFGFFVYLVLIQGLLACPFSRICF